MGYLQGMADASGEALTASQKFEEEARVWEETGKLQWCGQNQYAFTQLHCWLLSDGAKADGVSKRLKRYYSATKSAFQKKRRTELVG
jgi:hypothetical protein